LKHESDLGLIVLAQGLSYVDRHYGAPTKKLYLDELNKLDRAGLGGVLMLLDTSSYTHHSKVFFNNGKKPGTK
jgi:hypothetical protein